MANKNIFNTEKNPFDVSNAAGGHAYRMTEKAALSQIAATNCFNSTFYVSAEDNLEIAKNAVLALKNDPQFLAKCAIYSRNKGYMKDMPAFIMCALAESDSNLFRKVFPLVIDNGKMLRNFIQIARSGAIGKVINCSRSSIRKAVQQWFAGRNGYQLLAASIGNDPSMKDMLRIAHPVPANAEQDAMFAYLFGASYNAEKDAFELSNKEGEIWKSVPFANMPAIVREYEMYKRTKTGSVPKVDFRLLDSLGLGTYEWTEIARNAPWNMTRMNLNTFARHGVFDNAEVASIVANRLANRDEIKKARAFPYQLMSSWRATENTANVPSSIRNALQDAMEIAIENVPTFDGKVYVCVDTSGSMQSAATGERYGSTSTMTCIEVASLIASSILRKNQDAEIVPFATNVHSARDLNVRDTVMTNARKLAALGGGGTNCACALNHINAKSGTGSVVIYVSDYESWVEGNSYGRGTGLLGEWQIFKRRNAGAKLICIDLTPRSNSQVKENKDILQVGGFGDSVFGVMDSFVRYGNDVNHWVAEIERIDIDSEVAKKNEKDSQGSLFDLL